MTEIPAQDQPTKHEPQWLFSFDPGEKNIGWAMFKYEPDRKKANLRAMRIVHKEEFMDVLDTLDGLAKKHNTTFVVENFRVDTVVRGRAARSASMFQWSEMETIRIIGMIQYLAHRTKAPIILQEPRILSMARKWSPFRLTKHIADDKSAFLHGAHYMMQNRWITTVDDITMFDQERLV